MSYKDPTYVIFDGDNDYWAYRNMRGWKAREHIDFDFRDAHDLDSMTSRARDEAYVKRHLRERMAQSKAAIVLVGESTRYLYKYIRWELELAQEKDLPLIVVNLNGLRRRDDKLCPPIIRDACAIHIAFKMKAIQFALDNFPSWYRGASLQTKAGGWRYYEDHHYTALGI